jgi:hypothetical protein
MPNSVALGYYPPVSLRHLLDLKEWSTRSWNMEDHTSLWVWLADALTCVLPQPPPMPGAQACLISLERLHRPFLHGSWSCSLGFLRYKPPFPASQGLVAGPQLHRTHIISKRFIHRKRNFLSFAHCPEYKYISLSSIWRDWLRKRYRHLQCSNQRNKLVLLFKIY